MCCSLSVCKQNDSSGDRIAKIFGMRQPLWLLDVNSGSDICAPVPKDGLGLILGACVSDSGAH